MILAFEKPKVFWWMIKETFVKFKPEDRFKPEDSAYSTV